MKCGTVADGKNGLMGRDRAERYGVVVKSCRTVTIVQCETPRSVCERSVRAVAARDALAM